MYKPVRYFEEKPEIAAKGMILTLNNMNNALDVLSYRDNIYPLIKDHHIWKTLKPHFKRRLDTLLKQTI